MLNGALLVDKPSGPTSHDIVAFARRALETSGIGHTGTLDPLATGLLVLLVGQATRLSQFLVTDEKEYLADIRLGQSTSTYDAQGLDPEAGGRRSEVAVTTEQIRAVLSGFLGTFPQLPPAFSAKKVAGVRAYKKARRNEAVELTPVDVTVRELELLEPGPADLRPATADLLRLRIVCSAGFYVRSLAHDIGQRLGCGAHLEALRRTRAGRFRLADALTLEAIETAGAAVEPRLLGPNALLEDMPAVTLTDEGTRRAGHGNTLAPVHLAPPFPGGSGDGRVRLLDSSGRLLSVAERRADGLLHPLLVLR